MTVQSEVYRLDGMRTQLGIYCIRVYHTGPILETQASNVWLWYAIIQCPICVVQEYTLFNKTIQEQKCDLIEYDNTLSQGRYPVGQIMPLPRLKSYLTAGRAGEFDTTTENNTMLIQIQS